MDAAPEMSASVVSHGNVDSASRGVYRCTYDGMGLRVLRGRTPDPEGPPTGDQGRAHLHPVADGHLGGERLPTGEDRDEGTTPDGGSLEGVPVVLRGSLQRGPRQSREGSPRRLQWNSVPRRPADR